jgi:hypothetical protein
MATKKKTSGPIEIPPMKQTYMTFWLLGLTPFICNRMADKAWRELLFPKKKGGPRSALKHVPMAEFRSSPYVSKNDDDPTLIRHIATSVKKAMRGAALDIDGVTGTKIDRNVWILDEFIPIYGVPQLGMHIVRSADINKTPDVRTRACIPKWCTKITVRFMETHLTKKGVANLIATAGVTQGLGDWRNEKGSASYGSFEIVDEDHPEVQALIKTGCRKPQIAGMKDPEFFNSEADELFEWFNEEADRRGVEVPDLDVDDMLKAA